MFHLFKKQTNKQNKQKTEREERTEEKKTVKEGHEKKNGKKYS